MTDNDQLLADCRALLQDILPDMVDRVEGLIQAWPGAEILTALHRNEAHVRRIKELLARAVNPPGCRYPVCVEDNSDERCAAWFTGECPGPNI